MNSNNSLKCFIPETCSRQMNSQGLCYWHSPHWKLCESMITHIFRFHCLATLYANSINVFTIKLPIDTEYVPTDIIPWSIFNINDGRYQADFSVLLHLMLSADWTGLNLRHITNANLIRKLLKKNWFTIHMKSKYSWHKQSVRDIIPLWCKNIHFLQIAIQNTLRGH